MSILPLGTPTISMPTLQSASLPESVQPPKVAPVAEAGNTGMAGDQQQLDEAIAMLNQGLQAWSTNLRFRLEDGSNQIVIQVVDVETGEVVRQVPSEDVLHMSQALGKLRDLSFRATA